MADELRPNPDLDAAFEDAVGRLAHAADTIRANQQQPGQVPPADLRKNADLDALFDPQPTVVKHLTVSTDDAARPESPTSFATPPGPKAAPEPLLGLFDAESEALDRLAAAAEKLSKAADKLLGLGKEQKEKDDKPKKKDGEAERGGVGGFLQQMFGQHIRSLGSDLAGAVEGRLRGTFGNVIGRPAGQMLRGFIQRGTDQLVKQAPDLASRLFGQSNGGTNGTDRYVPSDAEAKRRGFSAEDVADFRTGKQGTYQITDHAGKTLEGKEAAAAEMEAGGAARAAGGAARAAGGAAAGAEGAAAAGAAELAAVAGPIGIAIAAAAALAYAMYRLGKAVTDGAKAQEQHNFRLADVSASMAMVKAQADAEDTFRNQDIGERTAGSAAMLSGANAGFKDGTQEIVVVGDRIYNLLYSTGLRVVTQLLQPLEKIANDVNDLLDLISEDDEGPSQSSSEMIEDALKKQRDRQADVDAWRRNA